MIGGAGFLKDAGEPVPLLGRHRLGGRVLEVLLAGGRVALVGVEHDEPAPLVLECVPERAEVQLVARLVLAGGLRAVRAAPVDVVVAGDREPGTQQAVHHALVLPHLVHPLGRPVVPLHEVADRHHQVRLEQVRVAHGVGEHGHALVRPAGAVAEDDEREGVLLARQRQIGRAGAGGAEPLGREGAGVGRVVRVRVWRAWPTLSVGAGSVVGGSARARAGATSQARARRWNFIGALLVGGQSA